MPNLKDIPTLIGILLVIGLLVFLGLSAHTIVTSYNDALTDATTLREDLKTSKEAVQQRDYALEKWQDREKELLKIQGDNARALEEKEAERAAAVAKYNNLIGAFRDEIEKLQGDDRFCAARTVPAAVDRLLARPMGESATAGAR